MNTVDIKGRAVKNEGEAAEIISAGMAVEIDSNGEIALSAGGTGTNHRSYATEAPERGKAANDGVYADGEQIAYIACAPGDEVGARTAAATFTVGSIVEQVATGLTQAETTGTPTGVVIATKTTTAADPLVHIRVL